MKTNKLMMMVLVAAVLVAAVVWTQSRKTQARKPAADSGAPVIAALQKPETLNAVEALSFVTAESTVRVAKASGVWIAPDRYNHPVKFEEVRKFLRSLADLKVGQGVPGGEKELAALELVAPAAGADGKAKSGSGTVVTASGKDGEALATVILGKTRSRGGEMSFPDGRFVLADGKAVLVGETFSGLPAKSVDWMETQLVDVYSSDVTALTWTPNGKSPIVLTNEGFELKLPGLATNEALDTAKSGKLSGIVSFLRFTDVADPSLKPADTGLDKPDVVVAKAKNGREYTVRIGKATTNALRYVSIAAAFTPAPQPEAPKADAAEDVKKRHEEDVKKRKEEDDKIAGEIREFNERAGKWVYVVEGSRFESLPMTRKDLLQVPEAKKPDAAAAPAPVAFPPMPAPAP